MKRRRVQYRQFDLTVSEATVAIGVERQRLRTVAGLDDTRPLEIQLLSIATYPDLMAAVVEQAGFDTWPVSFDEFMELPEQLVYQWEQAVYDLNPHWYPSKKAGDEEKAKQDADTVQKRLIDNVKRQKMAEKVSPELPGKIFLHNLDVSWRVFQLMEATGWQHLPSQVMGEPDWLLEDLLTLRGQKGIVERMLKG